jgi:hypothetical protein
MTWRLDIENKRAVARLKVWLYFCSAFLAILAPALVAAPTPFQLTMFGYVAAIGLGSVAFNIPLKIASIGLPVQLGLKATIVASATVIGFMAPMQVKTYVMPLLMGSTNVSEILPPSKPLEEVKVSRSDVPAPGPGKFKQSEETKRDNSNSAAGSNTIMGNSRSIALPPPDDSHLWIYRSDESTIDWTYVRLRSGQLVIGAVPDRIVHCNWSSRPIFCEKSDMCGISIPESSVPELSRAANLKAAPPFAIKYYDREKNLRPQTLESQLAASKDKPLSECPHEEKFVPCTLEGSNPYPERGFSFRCDGQAVFVDYYYQALRFSGDHEEFARYNGILKRYWPP